jgi:hypothetical protein
LGWFDTPFEHPTREHTRVNLSTSPLETSTHWRQTVFNLLTPVELKEGSVLTGTFSCCKDTENPRALRIELTYAVECDGVTGAATTQTFAMK